MINNMKYDLFCAIVERGDILAQHTLAIRLADHFKLKGESRFKADGYYFPGLYCRESDFLASLALFFSLFLPRYEFTRDFSNEIRLRDPINLHRSVSIN